MELDIMAILGNGSEGEDWEDRWGGDTGLKETIRAGFVQSSYALT